ncbi:hypothetical protein [Mucilaginibacter aquaedulcis]|uniref:hypothetical protein n=1 Tax=Mucilaginibacter aquaedulcis TaxID=1187081 RepID=UPI0025B3A150|nr:hypothetical protein [Mucilaginibacter aquaedulcis]MDN3548817.1 hypothetical protein [Mucilaginibacter aquaedulcis]
MVVLGAFFPGGTSVLAELAYLQEFTDIGAALQGSVSSVEEIKIWAGIQQGAAGLTTTIGELASTNKYLATVTNDQNERDRLLQYQQLMLLAMILSGGAAAISGAKLTSVRIANQANIIKPQIPDPPPAGFPTAIEQSVDYVIGNTLQTLSGIEAVVETLPLGVAANNICTIFNRFTDAQKLAFWTSFGRLSPRSWQYLNNGAGVNNWLKLYNNGIAEASKLDFITNQNLVDTILKFSIYPLLKAQFQSLSYPIKVRFFTAFKQINDATLQVFNTYSNSNRVQIWAQYNSEAQSIIGAKADIWLKLPQAMNYLKNNNYQAISDLYTIPIHPPTTLPNFPGVNYVTDNSIPISIFEDAAQIAIRTDDIPLIAANTGIPENIIQLAKQNFWIKERFLYNEIEIDDSNKIRAFQVGRFTKTKGDILQWENLAKKWRDA